MLPFFVGRLTQAMAVMVAVALVAFALFTYVGDPINNMVGEQTTRADRDKLRESLGLNDPVPLQFARFVANAAVGNFGISYRLKRPVDELIAERMPATLELVLISALVSLAIGIPLGVYTAIRRHSLISRFILTASLAGVSLPTFIIGIGLIYLFAVHWGVLPSFGRGEVTSLGWWSTGLLTASGLKALILPVTTVSLFQITLILRLVRAEMLEVLRSDYIRFARARGLTNRAINFGHAFKNTLVPVITIAGLNIASLIAFSIIAETVFQWPGMGFLFIQAIEFVDIPIMAAYLVMAALVFVTINLCVDMLYFVIDPRLADDTSTLPVQSR
ncbi:MAG: ABC transporter permease [Proteobacteria bacterium]|nr:ABC transporter permease [Pseudomonadota bacterium]